MNWVTDIFNNGQEKKAELTNQETEFERKIEANDWIKETMALPDEVEVEEVVTKEAAYDIGDTCEDTIEKDYKLALSGMSDYNLAEMLAELKTSADLLATLDFNEEKEKALKSVQSNRKSIETKILSLIGDHTLTDWKEAFKKFKEVDHVEPSEKDLYEQMPSGKWRKKVKFEPVSDKEKVEQMEGVGKEEEKGALAKETKEASLSTTASGTSVKRNWLVKTYDEDDNVTDQWVIENRTEHEAENEAMADVKDAADWSMTATKAKTASFNTVAYHSGDKAYYHGHPCVIKDISINPFSGDATAEVECNGETVHISGKELKELGTEPLMEDMVHEEAPAVIPEAPVVTPEIEKKPDEVIPPVEEVACMAGETKEATSEEAQDWISKKIEKLVGEGKSQEQAAAIAYSMAREKGFKVPEKKSELEPEIKTKASKADIITKFSMLSRHADIESPWRIIKNDKGEDIVARTAPTLREKKSKEKNKNVDITSQELQ